LDRLEHHSPQHRDPGKVQTDNSISLFPCV
jgi:hypothetical protein